MAAATAAADPPGYFVGRPLHYQKQQQSQAATPPASAADDHNAVNAQVPGYYAGRVQPKRGDETKHNTNGNAGVADKQNREPSFFAKWFARCFSGSS